MQKLFYCCHARQKGLGLRINVDDDVSDDTSEFVIAFDGEFINNFFKFRSHQYKNLSKTNFPFGLSYDQVLTEKLKHPHNMFLKDFLGSLLFNHELL